MVKEIMQVIKEGEELMKEVRQNINEERIKAGMYEKNESLKTWGTITKRITNEKTIEKLERVEGSMMMNTSDIWKQVGESNYEARRRMIVYNCM